MKLKAYEILLELSNGYSDATLHKEIEASNTVSGFEYLLSKGGFLEVHGTEIVDALGLNALVEAHRPDSFNNYKIYSIVDEAFGSLPIDKIDFTMHLKKGALLKKSVTKTPNGRPEKATYRYEEVPFAEIDWVFSDTSGGLFYKKEIFLCYFRADGTKGERFIIKRKEIDFTIPNELEETIQERIDARLSIVGEIKAVCSGALTVGLDQTLAEVVATISPFWSAYKASREAFTELGTKTWRDEITALDTAIDYAWLDVPIDANGTTCKQYMIFRMSY